MAWNRGYRALGQRVGGTGSCKKDWRSRLGETSKGRFMHIAHGSWVLSLCTIQSPSNEISLCLNVIESHSTFYKQFKQFKEYKCQLVSPIPKNLEVRVQEYKKYSLGCHKSKRWRVSCTFWTKSPYNLGRKLKRNVKVCQLPKRMTSGYFRFETFFRSPS